MLLKVFLFIQKNFNLPLAPKNRKTHTQQKTYHRQGIKILCGCDKGSRDAQLLTLTKIHTNDHVPKREWIPPRTPLVRDIRKIRVSSAKCLLVDEHRDKPSQFSQFVQPGISLTPTHVHQHGCDTSQQSPLQVVLN